MADKQKEMKFKRIKKEMAYQAHIFDVYNDYLELPDGRQVVYDYIDHVAGACVLPVDADGKLIFVRQYRNTIDQMTYEVPAGCIDVGEDAEACALRELREETGYDAGRLTFVTKTVLAIGTSNEQTYIYIGTDLQQRETKYDDNEFIDVHKFSLTQVVDMIRRGEIVDSKTLIAIFAYLSMHE